MPTYEATAWTAIEAADADEAFAIAVRLLCRGWDCGQIVDDGIRLLSDEDAEHARPEPVTEAQREQWRKWGELSDDGVHRTR